MKTNLKSNSILLGGLLLLGTVFSCTQAEQDYASYVNPFIGTGGHGHTYPGAVVPNGMIQPSPDTRIYEWDACSGYYYEDTTINGFSHTHVSGTGCADYGDVLLMPTVGKQEYHPMGAKSQQMAYCSAFSHDNEVAQPGYYSVLLERYNVKAELTATKRAAIHRYTFPEAEDAGFILDFDYSIERQTNEEMKIEVISDTEIRGHKKTVYWAFDQYINFYAKFSKPFTYTLVTDSVALEEGGPLLPTAKVLLQFPTAQNEEVLVKVGVSAVDMDGARKNVEAEIPGWDFDGVRSAARQAWNDYLSKIDIRTQNADQRTMFYTALYHTGLQPNLFTDADGRYFGMDLKPLPAGQSRHEELPQRDAESQKAAAGQPADAHGAGGEPLRPFAAFRGGDRHLRPQPAGFERLATAPLRADRQLQLQDGESFQSPQGRERRRRRERTHVKPAFSYAPRKFINELQKRKAPFAKEPSFFACRSSVTVSARTARHNRRRAPSPS